MFSTHNLPIECRNCGHAEEIAHAPAPGAGRSLRRLVARIEAGDYACPSCRQHGTVVVASSCPDSLLGSIPTGPTGPDQQPTPDVEPALRQLL